MLNELELKETALVSALGIRGGRGERGGVGGGSSRGKSFLSQ